MFSAILKPFTLASALAASTVAVLVRKSRRARFAYHITLYAGTLGLMSVWGVALSIAATVVGQRYNINFIIARSFYHLTSPLVGIRIKVEGREHLTRLQTSRDGKPQSAILVGNHQSFLDILYLGRIFPKRASIMAKRELIWAPLLGQYLAASGAVFVDRKNKNNALASLSKAGDDMKRRGISLWVFPEGTRSSSATPALLPFKKGAFHLAIQAQVPIVPVVCENYHHLFDGRTRMESGTLRLRVLPPIPTAGLTPDDVGALAESTRELMLRALVEISRPAPGLESSGSGVVAGAGGGARIEDKVRVGLVGSAKELEEGDDGESDGSATPVSATGTGVESAATLSQNGESSAEDEMDEDAVLLRRPRGARAAAAAAAT